MDKLLIKEQIRDAAFNMSGSMGTDAIDYVWDKIEDHAKQKAIAFAEWCVSNPDVYFNYGKDNKERFSWKEKTISSEKLYELSPQSLNK